MLQLLVLFAELAIDDVMILLLIFLVLVLVLLVSSGRLLAVIFAALLLAADCNWCWRGGFSSILAAYGVLLAALLMAVRVVVTAATFCIHVGVVLTLGHER